MARSVHKELPRLAYGGEIREDHAEDARTRGGCAHARGGRTHGEGGRTGRAMGRFSRSRLPFAHQWLGTTEKLVTPLPHPTPWIQTFWSPSISGAWSTA